MVPEVGASAVGAGASSLLGNSETSRTLSLVGVRVVTSLSASSISSVIIHSGFSWSDVKPNTFL